MRIGEKFVQRRVAMALAHLCSPDDRKAIFIDNNGKSPFLVLSLLVSICFSNQPYGNLRFAICVDFVSQDLSCF